MATTATPYGLKPLNEIGGLPYAGATRKLPITSGYNTNLFYGAVVTIATNGTIELVTTNGDNSTPFPAGTIGVFMGCSYTDATLGFVNRQMWPANTVASDALAFIVDDPNTLFQAQAAGIITQTDLGQNTHFNAVQSTSTGSTATGNSNTALDATTATTAGLLSESLTLLTHREVQLVMRLLMLSFSLTWATSTQTPLAYKGD